MNIDTIFCNGKMYTLNETNSLVSAIAVKDGVIIATGKDEEILALKKEHTEVVDLKGKTVLPSFTDCHVHLLGAGHGAVMIDAAEKSKEEILRLVKERAAVTEPGKWIFGIGWNQDLWEDSRFPTREELDEAAPKNPVKMIRYCGNAFWCNSMAIELAGLDDTWTESTAGKELLLNEHGKLAGTLVGEACRKIDAAIPEHDKNDIIAMVRATEKILFQKGITAIMDKGAGAESALATDCGRNMIPVLDEMYQNDLLKLRVYEAVVGEDEYFEDCFAEGAVIDKYDGRFTVRGIKLWSDGAFGPRTAWISEEYKGQKGHCGNQKFQDQELIDLFRKADEKDLQIAIHAIGDASAHQIINCYEKAFCDSMDKDRRFIIDHFHIPKEGDIERLIKYGIINSTQFIQLSSDMEVLQDILSDELIQNIYPWRDILDRGGIITNGSDVPVDPVDPFPSLYVAVSRKSLKNINCIEEEPYGTLSRLEAVRTYTTNAAYSMFSEKTRGSLEIGKYADFIVLDRDYFSCSEEEIKEIVVLKTVLNGETVYDVL